MDDNSTTTSVPKAVIAGFGFGVLIALPAVVAAIASAGFGHGDYVMTRALFPAPMLLTLVEGRIGDFSIALGLLQFPIYGAILGWAKARQNYLPAILLAGLHLVAAAACFTGILQGFS